MKYCPNCGSVRNDKDVCECGYSYNEININKKH